MTASGSKQLIARQSRHHLATAAIPVAALVNVACSAPQADVLRATSPLVHPLADLVASGLRVDVARSGDDPTV